MLHGPGKAVLTGFVNVTLGFDLAIHHLAAVGEEDGRVVTPHSGVCLPDVFDVVALADNALDLGTPGGDREF